jgi:hypothetical protein
MNINTRQFINELLITESMHAANMIRRHQQNIEQIKSYSPVDQQESLIQYELNRINYHATIHSQCEQTNYDFNSEFLK